MSLYYLKFNHLIYNLAIQGPIVTQALVVDFLVNAKSFDHTKSQTHEEWDQIQNSDFFSNRFFHDFMGCKYRVHKF